ncbi:fucose permease [Palleronia aestuarii]|uniref:Fucose permease n=1 Tax=Palleronia aestuarii TaxID=568105 RepID=A0A2W7P0S2_9RHOB|nr:MFS transporter [Palleronia aestuarii]PZX19056.1 fucose permease [Palleronia aestuarii]
MSEVSAARRAVIAVFALNGALFAIWAARIPAFVERFALGPDALGLLLLCIAGGAIVSFPLTGRLADRIGAARLTRLLLPLYAIAVILVALAPNVALLAVALALLGAGYGALDVAMNAWGAEVEQAAGRPIMSFFHAMYSLGAGLGAATGWAAVAVDLPPAIHFALVVLPASALTMWLARAPWTSRTSDDGPAFALPRGALALVGIVAFASSMGEGAMADWSALFLVAATGTTEAQAALGYAVFSAAMVAMRLAGDRVVARTGPVLAARMAGLVAALGVALVVAAPSLGPALAGFALLGLGYAVIFPLAFSRAARDPDLPAGRAIAAVATLGYGGMLLGPPLIGWVASATSLQAGFALVGVLALLITALAGSLR